MKESRPDGLQNGYGGRSAPGWQVGLALLCRAEETARRVALAPERLAVQLQAFQALGLSATDLRTLLRRGLAEPLQEPVSNPRSRRKARRIEHLRLNDGSHLRLTERGRREAWKHATALLPSWNASDRELWLARVLDMKLCRVAPDQELLLTTFQELGWPRRIDSPWPASAHERLRNAIKKLNRHSQFVCFHGDGTGVGAC